MEWEEKMMKGKSGLHFQLHCNCSSPYNTFINNGVGETVPRCYDALEPRVRFRVRIKIIVMKF